MPSKGLDLKEYQSKLSNNRYAIRTGNEVPEGDVNLAYIHTPSLDSDDNVSLLDMTATPDNVIPEEQLESIAYSDKQGKLHYAHIVQEYDPVVEKPPYEVFPSPDVKITREFKKNEHTTNNALYYKFDLKYHFDSKEGTINKVVKYTGQQIEITDEQGNPLDDSFKYDIYVMAQEKNPHIHWVRIYLHKNTDEEQTFKVRYNHVETITSSNNLKSVRKEIQLYANKDNAGVIEGGKLRVINGVGAFDKLPEDKFSNALEDDEVYKVVERSQGDGYELFVPQKSEDDPRALDKFNYKVTASYKNAKGKMQKVTVGYINDWVLNEQALLEHEKLEYSKEWKQLGVPYDNFKLNANQMVEMALPLGTPSMPEETTYEISDANGNLLYTTTSAADNVKVASLINAARRNYAEAKSLSNVAPWKNAKKKNVRLKSKEIAHNCSIIAEQQKTKWDFSWKATGQGVIKTPLVYNANWWACANVGVYKGFSTNPIDVANKSKWSTIGKNVTLSDWKVDSGKIELKVNELDVGGFYQLKAPDGSDMFQKDNYEFSARVKVTDPGDDDVIGLVFRVKNSKEYYMFAWEKEQHPLTVYNYKASDGDGSMAGKSNGPARILMGSGGITAFYYDGVTKAFPESQFSTDSSDKYLNQMGFAKNKKRIFKVKPRSGSGYTGYYPGYEDVTGVSFTDITTKGTIYNSAVGKVGWSVNKEYKLTIVTTGNHYQIYINENAASTERGTLVCEAYDSTYMKGSCGIFCVSQRWTQWSKMVFNEIDVTSVCTARYPVTLNSQTQVKVSTKRLEDLMKDAIDAYAKSKYGSAKYEVFNYSVQSDKTDLELDIDENGRGFVWATTNNSDAGGVKLDPFKTSDHGLDVFGTGTVQYHEDGEFTILSSPDKLPTELIPDNVEEFKWNQPQLLTGQSVSLSLASDGESIVVTAQIPPIIQLNKWVILPIEKIRKNDGIVSLEDVFEPGGIYDRLGISNIPIDEVLLRIERGSATGPFTTSNPEHRVNYRFRVNADGLIRMPVDQFQDQLGVNRIRLSTLFQTYKSVKFDINYSVLVPKTITTDMKDLFARNASGAVMVEKTPGAAKWEVVDGVLTDKENRYSFAGVYNSKHLSMRDHKTDFAFKPIPTDDDLLGVMFRVQDKNNFYFYAIEGDKILGGMGSSRLADQQPLPLQEWLTTSRVAHPATEEEYINNRGWKNYHQRVYKVKNGVKTLVKQISTKSNQGFINDWINNIRIECVGQKTDLFFQTGLAEEDKWDLIYSVDTEWNKGAFGVFNYSQRVEFQNISTVEYEELSGTLTGLEATGNPVSIFAENTKDFCHSHVVEKIIESGMSVEEDYLPVSYTATKKTSDGNVLVSLNGQGPIQVFSIIDPTIRIGDVDVVAWTHYEALEAIPIFGVKVEDRKRIEIEKPKVERSDMEIDNWYLRVKKGKFQKKIQLPYYEAQEKTPQLYLAYPQLATLKPSAADQNVEVILEYSIPEYDFQEFYDQPVVLIERERPIILNEYAIQTRYAPIQLKSEFGISYLEVEAIRKNHSRKLRISDVDAAKGIIFLHDRIREQDEILVRYAYEEQWYTYTGFEKRNTGSGKNEFFHLDLNPSPGHKLTLAKENIFKWIPIDADKSTYTTIEEDCNQLLVKPIHMYMRPQLIRKADGTIISGTQKDFTLYHTDEEHWFDPRDYYHDPSMFKLAKVMLQVNSRIDKDMVVLDTRTRGGGLDEALSREIIERVNKESLYHWDIGFFDGEAYQENGVMIIRLPKTILDSFHETEVQAAVAKHKTYGVLPIIEYYDVEKINQQDKNLLINPEFYNGDHISYHDAAHDKGAFNISYQNEGTGDNYVLQLKGGARYGVTIPGYRFEKDRHYRLEIKARMNNNALPRKAANIEIHYQDGSRETYATSFINHIDWMIYKKSFEIKRDVTKINIVLNDDSAFGDVFIDYLLLFPHLEVDENTAEILEI